MVQQLQPTAVAPDWLYPESDGLPLSDNTIQFRLITTIQGGIDSLFADDPNIFVAGDLLWYPVEAVEGVSKSQAPDVMVVFGRPKGDRRSYKQFTEDNIAPQVVFEILSKSNTSKEMEAKFNFYERYGVEEYYLYDPANNVLKGWLKQDKRLIPIGKMEGWRSPRLGCRFETGKGSLELYRPDGKRMETYVETSKRAQREAQRAEQEAQRAEQEAQRAEQEAQRAEQEAQRAQQEAQRAEQEAQRAEQEAQRAQQEAQRAEQEAQRAEQETQRAQQEAQARRDAIPRLLALGLSVEQVAQALNLSVEEVNQSH
ncbi:MAG: Uma2 family endonuclease [Symploca sp. SIO2C1]|nr:Uma2 family endonuclease [Symploca sp. SIO2C1]